MSNRTTFLNDFLNNNDWKRCKQFFRVVSCKYFDKIDLKSYSFIYIISGELAVYYPEKKTETIEDPVEERGIIRILKSGDAACLNQNINNSSSSLIVYCSSQNAKYIYIDDTNLMKFLSRPSLQEFQRFFNQSTFDIIKSNLLFRDLSPLHIDMIANSMQFVSIQEGSLLCQKGHMASPIGGGYFAILLHGKACEVQRNTYSRSYLLSENSIHKTNQASLSKQLSKQISFAR